jgi:MYXO-CTERM domain-containing protein
VSVSVSASTSVNAAVVLSAMQGLGSLSDVRVFSLGLRLAPAFNAFAPRDLATASRPASFHYTWGVKWFMVGASFGARDAFTLSPGFALTFGVPVTRWFEPLAQVDLAYWLRTANPDEPAPLVYSFLGGVRLRMNGLAPLYASVLGGWQIATSRSPQTVGDGAIVDVGFGLNLLPCGGALQIGGFNSNSMDAEESYTLPTQNQRTQRTLRFIDPIDLTGKGLHLWIGNGFGGSTTTGTWNGTITLHGVTGIPAPGALALLGLAGLTGRRRR